VKTLLGAMNNWWGRWRR